MCVCFAEEHKDETLAKDAVRRFNVKLLDQLPLHDPVFYGMLKEAELLPLNTGPSIEALNTRAEKVSYFLQHVIEPAASDTLPTLIKVMKKCKTNNLVKLATKIQAAAEPGTYNEIFYYESFKTETFISL